MRILLTGIHGQVGFELLRSLEPLGELIPADRALMDLSGPDSIRAYLREVRPQLIVNPAAYTAVDRAEADAEACHAINATAVGVIGKEAAALGAVVIHYSTDYVFDGQHDQPYTEEHATAPCNVYGASKLAGERLLAASGAQHLILRTSWVYSLRGSNFLLTMLRLSQERPQLRIVCDQIGAPTWSRYIAERTAALVARHVVQAEERARLRCPSGIVHMTAGGSTSWADFAREIFALAGRSTLVEDIPASAYPTAAQRPANSRLDCGKLATLLGCPGESWQEGLVRCLKGDG